MEKGKGSSGTNREAV